MTDDAINPNTAEMAARIKEIQVRRRGRIRWSIGKHTAEMAIAALSRAEYRRSGKCRRRKRAKRLL